jgi:hypothetical protein
VPPRADAVLSATAEIEPTQRDSGCYNERAHVEGRFARWKQVSGDGLRFHSDQAQAQATEVAIAAAVLNRMLDLGCPNSVRVA